MAQGYASVVVAGDAFAVTNGGTDHTAVQLVSTIEITWSDAVVETWTPPQAILSAYDGSPTFDTTTDVWLLVLTEGAPPLVLKESDYPTNMDTVLDSATWFVRGRVEADVLWPVPAL